MRYWASPCLTQYSRSPKYEPKQAQPRFRALTEIRLAVSRGDKYPKHEAFGSCKYANFPQRLRAAVVLDFLAGNQRIIMIPRHGGLSK